MNGGDPPPASGRAAAVALDGTAAEEGLGVSGSIAAGEGGRRGGVFDDAPNPRLAARGPWVVLPMRTLLFAATQIAFTAGFALTSSDAPFSAARSWWLLSATVANLVMLGLLVVFARAEGKSVLAFYNLDTETWPGDLAWFVAALLLSGPIAFLPNTLLATALFGDPQTPMAMLSQPLPIGLAVALVVVFPLLHALVELPTYYGYAMPRLQAMTGRTWAPLVLTAFWLSAQHVALPLSTEWRFMVWRFGTFVPLALFLGWVVHRRPTVMPYLLVVHAVVGLQLPLFAVLASVD